MTLKFLSNVELVEISNEIELKIKIDGQDALLINGDNILTQKPLSAAGKDGLFLPNVVVGSNLSDNDITNETTKWASIEAPAYNSDDHNVGIISLISSATANSMNIGAGQPATSTTQIRFFVADDIDTSLASSLVAIDTTFEKTTFGNITCNKTSNAITASTIQVIGQQILTSSINEVSVVENENDSVTLPPTRIGMEIKVINNGLNTLQVFPYPGSNLGQGEGLSTFIPAGEMAMFIAITSTTLVTITGLIVDPLIPAPDLEYYLNIPGVVPNADPLVAANKYTQDSGVAKSAVDGEKKLAILVAFKPTFPNSGGLFLFKSTPDPNRDFRLEVRDYGGIVGYFRTDIVNSHQIDMGSVTENELVYVYMEIDFDTTANGGTEEFLCALNGVESDPISVAGQIWHSTDHGICLEGGRFEGNDTKWYTAAAWYNKKPIKSEALAYEYGDDLSSMTVPPDAHINFTGVEGNYADALTSIIGSFTWSHNSGSGGPVSGGNHPVFEAE